MFPEPVHHVQFYYLDSFMLVSSGPELQLLRHHLDPHRDELRRWVARQGLVSAVGGSVPATGDVGSSVCTDTVFTQTWGPHVTVPPASTPVLSFMPDPGTPPTLPWSLSCPCWSPYTGVLPAPRTPVSPTSMPGSAGPGPDHTPHSPVR